MVIHEVIFYMVKNLFDEVKFILKDFAFSFAFRMQFLFAIILRQDDRVLKSE